VRQAFPDLNGDAVIAVMATSETYLSFFESDSQAAMPASAARLQAPLLYVVGSDDPLQRGSDEIFAKAPAHPLNRYATIDAGHFGTSAASADTVVAWLRAVAASN
jgi:pimeloyl-ACP methyl ester carboxylesterase